MGNKIIVAIILIGVIGALAGGTTAGVFKDVETSSMNSFTAGEMDVETEKKPERTDLEMNRNGSEAELELENFRPGSSDEAVFTVNNRNRSRIKIHVSGEGEIADDLNFNITGKNSSGPIYSGKISSKNITLDPDLSTEEKELFNASSHQIVVEWKLPENASKGSANYTIEMESRVPEDRDITEQITSMMTGTGEEDRKKSEDRRNQVENEQENNEQEEETGNEKLNTSINRSENADNKTLKEVFNLSSDLSYINKTERQANISGPDNGTSDPEQANITNQSMPTGNTTEELKNSTNMTEPENHTYKGGSEDEENKEDGENSSSENTTDPGDETGNLTDENKTGLNHSEMNSSNEENRSEPENSTDLNQTINSTESLENFTAGNATEATNDTAASENLTGNSTGPPDIEDSKNTGNSSHRNRSERNIPQPAPPNSSAPDNSSSANRYLNSTSNSTG